MNRILSSMGNALRNVEWKKTSLTTIISGSLCCLLSQEYFLYPATAGYKFQVLLALCITSQLACWFGGLFRVAVGSALILTSLGTLGLFLKQIWTGELLAHLISSMELVPTVGFWLFLIGLPLLLRAEIFAHSSEELVSLKGSI